MENNINKIFNQKDKRISYLSILHSLAILHQGQNLEDNKLSEFATTLTDALFIKYPTPGESELPSEKIMAQQARETNGFGEPIKGKLCPVCQSPMIRQTQKKNPKSPDWKCSNKSCKFKKAYDGGWRKSDFITSLWDKPDESRARNEDNLQNDARQNFGEFGKPI